MDTFNHFDASMPDFITPGFYPGTEIPYFGSGSPEWNAYQAAAAAAAGLYPPGNLEGYSGHYPGIYDYTGMANPTVALAEEPMRLDLSAATLDLSSHSSGLIRQKSELSESAPAFIPPPPGLGVSDSMEPSMDLSLQPAKLNMQDMVSDLTFPPPGLASLTPPPGLAGGAASASHAAAKTVPVTRRLGLGEKTNVHLGASVERSAISGGASFYHAFKNNPNKLDSTPGSLSTAADSFAEELLSSHSRSGDEAPPPAPDVLQRSVTWPQDAVKQDVMSIRIDVARELRVENETNGDVNVYWPVDARKVQGKDRQVVSSSFTLFPDVSCRLMIKPKPKGLSKGLSSFQKARGCGSLELKLVEGAEKVPAFSFSLSIGSHDKQDGPRGPVHHDFSSTSVCGVSKGDEDWDFKAAVDEASGTFLVCLTVHCS